jgi:dihydrodipicolinate synthase/N-acetylneuraminate lyase
MKVQQIRNRLFEGLVIPAMPLSLHKDGSFNPLHQKALLRYYIDSGAGGIAAAVHTTQFEIRDIRNSLLTF